MKSAEEKRAAHAAYMREEGLRVNVKASLGPNLAKLDAVVPKKLHHGRVEDMRAKLTDDQRRNLHIAIFGPYFVR